MSLATANDGSFRHRESVSDLCHWQTNCPLWTCIFIFTVHQRIHPSIHHWLYTHRFKFQTFSWHTCCLLSLFLSILYVFTRSLLIAPAAYLETKNSHAGLHHTVNLPLSLWRGSCCSAVPWPWSLLLASMSVFLKTKLNLLKTKF
jgi:hypothetical protein